MIKRKQKLPRKSLRYEINQENSCRIYPDGREVCLDNKAGQLEYRRRTVLMAQRQNGVCSRGSHKLVNPTFDHSTSGRGLGGGRRDDRIYDSYGNQMNSASCFHCNGAAGSKRLP